MPLLVRTGAFVGGAVGFAAVGGTVGLASGLADGAGVADGSVVSDAVGCGRGLGASGGVTVTRAASVAGAAGRGVRVGVGVGPDAAGEHALSSSPTAIAVNMAGQSGPARRVEGSLDIIIMLRSISKAGGARVAVHRTPDAP
jgi:hypothetical protein